MNTLNAAMMEQQTQQRNSVSDLVRQINRLKEERKKLEEELSQKMHALELKDRLKNKDSDERLAIEEIVWEGRLLDASEKFKQHIQELRCQHENELEQIIRDRDVTKKISVGKKGFFPAHNKFLRRRRRTPGDSQLGPDKKDARREERKKLEPVA